MKCSTYRPGYVDTARPLPFQMRHARWLEGDGDEGGDGDGGAGDDGQDDASDDGTEDGAEDGQDDGAEGADDLGDKGKQALDRMKAKWRDERAARRKAEADLAAASTKDGDDEERRRRDAELTAKANQRILRSEIKAAAAAKLADPADAYKFLDLDQFEVDDDGNVDEDEIAEAIADLIRKKPYLAAQSGRRFQGGADGGTRKEARPKQWTRADLAGKTPQQISEAKAKGQLADLLKTPKN